MNPRSDVQEFFDSARSQGATDEIIVGLLRGRGWPEEDVYRALADHFEARSSLPVPIYKRSGSTKDAFLYLLSFSTLTTWTIGLGSVIFTLIDGSMIHSAQAITTRATTIKWLILLRA